MKQKNYEVSVYDTLFGVGYDNGDFHELVVRIDKSLVLADDIAHMVCAVLNLEEAAKHRTTDASIKVA